MSDKKLSELQAKYDLKNEELENLKAEKNQLTKDLAESHKKVEDLEGKYEELENSIKASEIARKDAKVESCMKLVKEEHKETLKNTLEKVKVAMDEKEFEALAVDLVAVYKKDNPAENVNTALRGGSNENNEDKEDVENKCDPELKAELDELMNQNDASNDFYNKIDKGRK